jgi:hypothetical protein
MLRREAAAWWRGEARSLSGRSGAEDSGRAALLTVVAHHVPCGGIAVDPLYTKLDGTRVTSFGPCLQRFAGGAEFGTEEHGEGLEVALRQAQGEADLEAVLDDRDCYGAATNTLRFNAALPAATLRRMLAGNSAHTP